MGVPTRLRPPWVYLWLLRLASWLVPPRQRKQWRAHHESALRSWWVLVERGEFPAGASRAMLSESWQSFGQAFFARFQHDELASFARKPAPVYLAMIAAFLLVAAASRGFSATRVLYQSFTSFVAYSSLTLSNSMPVVRDTTQNQVLAHGLPMAFAAVIAVVLFFIRARDMRWYGWRYRAYFAAKLAGLFIIVPAVWVETVPLLLKSRALGEGVMVGAATLAALSFPAVFGWAMRWAIVDQRERCPVCLSRLVMPVRIGSWASVFEPATTELLCPEGHGTLSVLETEDTEPEQWSTLDESWRDLFEPAVK